MRTYEFDAGNESLNREVDKSRKFSKTILAISLILLILIILGTIWIFRSVNKSLQSAYQAGEAAINNAKNSSQSNNQIGRRFYPPRNNQNPFGINGNNF